MSTTSAGLPLSSTASPVPSSTTTTVGSAASAAAAQAAASSAPSTATSAGATWETLRKQAQQLEGEIDARLVAFGKLGSSFSGRGGLQQPVGSERVSETTALQIEDLLRKLSDLVESMSRTLEEMGPSATSAMMHTLQRHRDILFDTTKEFKKTKANIVAAREHAELLQSVQEDINVYKSTRGETLLTERESIDRSNKMADQILETAFAAQEQLRLQRNSVYNTTNRAIQVLATLPGVGQLIQKISSRKKRDNIILSVVIAVCIIFLLLWLFF